MFLEILNELKIIWESDRLDTSKTHKMSYKHLGKIKSDKTSENYLQPFTELAQSRCRSRKRPEFSIFNNFCDPSETKLWKKTSLQASKQTAPRKDATSVTRFDELTEKAIFRYLFHRFKTWTKEKILLTIREL